MDITTTLKVGLKKGGSYGAGTLSFHVGGGIALTGSEAGKIHCAKVSILGFYSHSWALSVAQFSFFSPMSKNVEDSGVIGVVNDYLMFEDSIQFKDIYVWENDHNQLGMSLSRPETDFLRGTGTPPGKPYAFAAFVEVDPVGVVPAAETSPAGTSKLVPYPGRFKLTNKPPKSGKTVPHPRVR